MPNRVLRVFSANQFIYAATANIVSLHFYKTQSPALELIHTFAFFEKQVSKSGFAGRV
jgi:hypothetical protein